MRAIWSGEITFGLVNVPVKLYSATRSHDISFHQVHDEDNGRIRNKRVCEVCGREVDYEDIEKAFDDGDKTVILTDEELDSLPADENREIEVVQFVPENQIDPLLLGTAYLLEPVSKSPKSYALLRRTLEATEKTAIVTFTLRSKTRLGILHTRGNLLTLQTMRWPEDVQDVDFPAASKSTRISEKELEMSAALVEQFSGDFAPEQYTDEYQEQLRTLIEEKLEKGDSIDTEETFGAERAAAEAEKKESSSGSESSGGGKVLSLMDALERSLQRRRAGGGESEKSESEKSESAKSSSSSGGTSAKKPSGGKSSGGKSSGGKKKASSSSSGKSTADEKKASGTSKATKKTTAKKTSAKKSTTKKSTGRTSSAAKTATKKAS